MTPRRAIITGASSALGLEFIRQLSAHCDELVLCGRRSDRLEQAATALAPSACTLDIVTADLSTTIGIARLVETIRQRGPFRYLINNADSGAFGPFSRQEPATHEAMISVHIQASLQLTLAALAGMQQTRSGYIVNVSSLAALTPVGGSAVYGGSKAFLNCFSQALQQELGDQGIRIQCLCPGDTRVAANRCEATPGVDAASAPPTRQMDPEEVVSQSLEALHGTRQQVVLVPAGAQKHTMAT